MKQAVLWIIFSLIIFLNITSCQRKTSETDADLIDDAITYLDQGQAQKAIDILSPLTVYNKTPKVMSIIASAYLYRSEISTHEIINLFLNFSIQSNLSAQTSIPENEMLKEFTHMVLALDDFFFKLAAVPEIKRKDQEADINTALSYLKSATPSTPSIALQRGFIRLILAKYIFNKALETAIVPIQNNKCEFSWEYLYTNLENLLQVFSEILVDLKEANPKKNAIWDASLESISNTQLRIQNLNKNKTTNTAEQDMFIYFLNSHFMTVGCRL
jgi:hypothetical protein